MDRECNTARGLAPEDVRPGDYVAVLHVLERRDACYLVVTDKPLEPAYVFRPPGGHNMPVRVEEVCVPFVLVRTAQDKLRVLDLRQCRLARVHESFGRSVFDAAATARTADAKENDAAATETSDATVDGSG